MAVPVIAPPVIVAATAGVTDETAIRTAIAVEVAVPVIAPLIIIATAVGIPDNAPIRSAAGNEMAIAITEPLVEITCEASGAAQGDEQDRKQDQNPFFH